MRTTLDIEDDVLEAAKELAAREGSTAGRVLSALARKGLTSHGEPGEEPWHLVNGVPVVRSMGDMITNAFVQRLMDEEGI